MPRTGGGIYSLPAIYLATPGTTILAEQHNIPLQDIEQALTGSLPRDGTAPMTGNLPMGGRKITGLGEPTADNDAARKVDLPALATETKAGILERATNAEVITGTDLTRAVTPAGLAAALGAYRFFPPGAVVAFAAGTDPAGWITCNGGEQSRTTYAALFAVIGTTYGNGNGTTTFNLPDLRGEFIRGADLGRGVDTGRVLGSNQGTQDARVTDFRTAIDPAGEQGTGASFISNDGEWSPWRITGRSGDGNDIHIGFRTNGFTDTRPRNVAMRYCIKT